MVINIKSCIKIIQYVCIFYWVLTDYHIIFCWDNLANTKLNLDEKTSALWLILQFLSNNMFQSVHSKQPCNSLRQSSFQFFTQLFHTPVDVWVFVSTINHTMIWVSQSTLLCPSVKDPSSLRSGLLRGTLPLSWRHIHDRQSFYTFYPSQLIVCMNSSPKFSFCL